MITWQLPLRPGPQLAARAARSSAIGHRTEGQPAGRRTRPVAAAPAQVAQDELRGAWVGEAPRPSAGLLSGPGAAAMAGGPLDVREVEAMCAGDPQLDFGSRYPQQAGARPGVLTSAEADDRYRYRERLRSMLAAVARARVSECQPSPSGRRRPAPIERAAG